MRRPAIRNNSGLRKQSGYGAQRPLSDDVAHKEPRLAKTDNPASRRRAPLHRNASILRQNYLISVSEITISGDPSSCFSEWISSRAPK